MSRETLRRMGPSLVLLAAMLAVLIAAYGYDASARTLPVLVAVATIVLLVLELLVQAGTRAGRTIESLFQSRDLFPAAPAAPLAKALQHALVWPAVIATLVLALGLLPAVLIYVVASLKITGGKSWGRALLVAALVTAASWLLFEWAMSYPLYRGILWRQLAG